MPAGTGPRPQPSPPADSGGFAGALGGVRAGTGAGCDPGFPGGFAGTLTFVGWFAGGVGWLPAGPPQSARWPAGRVCGLCASWCSCQCRAGGSVNVRVTICLGVALGVAEALKTGADLVAVAGVRRPQAARWSRAATSSARVPARSSDTAQPRAREMTVPRRLCVMAVGGERGRWFERVERGHGVCRTRRRSSDPSTPCRGSLG